jgi:hypothetical protein
MLDGISTLIFADGADLVGALGHADAPLGVARPVKGMGRRLIRRTDWTSPHETRNWVHARQVGCLTITIAPQPAEEARPPGNTGRCPLGSVRLLSGGAVTAELNL